MFQRILIANRGEIACRVIRTCRRLGIEAVAVYSEADVSAMHVREADLAVEIGGARPADSYLNIDRIMQAARRTGAQAIHPGYGFLAENAAFARACEQAGIVFIGPKPSTIDRMGSKAEAKALMEKAGVPVVPGYHGKDQKDKTLHAEAERIGFPMMIKPAAGGGGKGMRIVHDADGFAGALEGARREADNAFGDTRMILERYVEGPRHIEFQVFGDSSGKIIHLYERECSVQRRYQKIIEETPSPFLDDDTRKAMGDAAVKAARAVDYVGAGTVEFIVGADREFFFMEMNTRLQVEHPVTEMTTGVDLVEWQIRVAAGESLPAGQDDIRPRGHAIEARLYAEDPYQNFMPSSGPLHQLRLPSTSNNVRIDSGVEQGDAVTIHYDPMIAKLIVRDANRQTAVARLQNALESCYVNGLATNIGFLIRLAHHQRFLEADIDTGFLDRNLDEVLPAGPELPADALAAAAAHWLLEREARARETARGTGDPWSPWASADAWHPGVAAARPLTFRHGQAEHALTATGSAGRYELSLDGEPLHLEDARIVDDGIRFAHDGETRHVAMARLGRGYQVNCRGARWLLFYVDPFDRLAEKEADEHRITAPMPGRVVAVKTKEGDSVTEGQELVVVEAMKMEITLRAPHDGTVAKVLHAEGDFVEADVALVELDRESSDS